MSKATLFDSRIKKYAYCEPSEIYRDIGASPDGLPIEQIESMREKYGKNSFNERKNDTTMQRLRRAFINPFHVILFVLGIVSLITDVFVASNFARNATTAIIIFSMILISGVIRLIQELRAKSAAAQLDRLIHESVTVRRAGELMEIPTEELVVGDLVLFSTGDRVPADVRILDAKDLFVSQASLTGESEPIEKTPNVSAQKESVTDCTNIAFMGSNVISGSATAVVVCVGDHTLFGSMAFAVAGEAVETSFTKGVNAVSWVLIGYLAFLDPPKESTADAVKALKDHGVTTKILTGDNDKVTRTICKQVGMKVRNMLLGSDLEYMAWS